MIQCAFKFYSERTSHDLAQATQRLASSKIQDLIIDRLRRPFERLVMWHCLD
jgi:hypothetical protein